MRDAVLAARAGLKVPGGSDSEVAKVLGQIAKRRRIETLLTAAAAYYHSVLPSKLRKSLYNEHYGFSDETVDSLLLGWGDGHLFEHMTGLPGVTVKEAMATGLFVRLQDGRIKDFFNNRLVFPYWKNGRVTYFIGRRTEYTGDEPWEKG